MKPTIIYIKADGKLDLTQEQLDKLITDAYQQGYNEGFYAGTKVNQFTYPNTVDKDWKIRYDQVTCMGSDQAPHGAECACSTAQSASDAVEMASEQ